MAAFVNLYVILVVSHTLRINLLPDIRGTSRKGRRTLISLAEYYKCVWDK